MIVAFQGEYGSFSEEAVIKQFGKGVTMLPKKTITSVFMSVEAGEAEAGVVPIENSIEGPVNETYDRLLTTGLKVIGEINMRIRHCLIGLYGASVSDIKRVYSHPQAIGQCRAYLESLGVELFSTYDTAGSVKMIKEMGDPTNAAIASQRAAEIYEMEVLASDIEDYGRNYTRFLIIGYDVQPPSGADKTSVIFSVAHRPGALYNAIGAFAERGINLTKIESRPTRARPWQYNFYVDFEGHIDDDLVRNALTDLTKKTLFLKVLGSYRAAPLEFE
ncbi:MAG: prephenate dehydratase [Aigarchaeota archaeon]|nr:prephenate dehydratase [Aigarchaeota archaeon]MDW8093219.1 prephenate dehydratase [Nitrososphaerota archaeon]